MKKLYIICSLAVLAFVLQSGKKFHTTPPNGYTGALGEYCNACHTGTNNLNASGGGIVATGLPTGQYIAGQTYPFSITINHATANRLRFGFSIAARKPDGTAIGTFSTTNPVAAINANTGSTNQELSHFNTVVSATATNTFTFNNLFWTAPPSLPANANVTFYFVGNATNGNSTNQGDFIYSGSTSVILPIELKNFSASVLNNKSALLKWETASESNSDYFEIQKSDNNQLFYTVGQVAAAGNSSVGKTYNYTDNSISYYDRPVFYRLNLVDRDGKSKLSKTVSVKLKGGASLVQNIFPSIIKPGMFVTANILSDKSQPLQIDLIDINGRVLQSFRETLVDGNNTIDFKLPATLPSQWLFARFTAGTMHQTMPLIVNP